MNSGKVVNRNIAIALGVICVVLIAGLTGAVINYTGIINDKDSQIQTLTNQIIDKNSQISNLTDIVQLRKVTILDANRPVTLTPNSVFTIPYSTPYAGIIKIDFSATSPIYFAIGTNHVNATYTRYPYGSADTTPRGSFYAAVFPGNTSVQIFNPNLFLGVTATVTVTYIY